MNQAPNLWYSIATAKCPKCRKGNMFPAGTLYSRQFADMHPNCSCCGQDFEQEPGYYYGAMYVSFALNVGIFLVTIFLLSLLVKEVTTAMVAGVVLAVVVGFLPIIFRLSRAIWINIFIHYDATACQSLKTQN